MSYRVFVSYRVVSYLTVPYWVLHVAAVLSRVLTYSLRETPRGHVPSLTSACLSRLSSPPYRAAASPADPPGPLRKQNQLDALIADTLPQAAGRVATRSGSTIKVLGGGFGLRLAV